MSDKTLELQIKIAAEEAARIVSGLKDDLKKLSEEAMKYAKNNGAELNKSFKEAESAAKDTANGINDIKRNVGDLAQAAVATKVLSFVKDLGAFALQTADNFNTAKQQFGILLGDMEAGAGLFNEIKAFNDVTPFDLDTLTQATNVLVAAKVPLADLQNQLTKFGDLSQGNSQRLTSYVHAFSQAAAKGKADMQVLNTYLNQGVPILDALAKNFSVTTAEIMEMSSKGQISFSDFSKALDDLTAAGGQYFGGMELASKSLAAMQEGLSEAVKTLGASFGETLLPPAIAVVDALTKITNAINESPILKGMLTAGIITLTGLLGAMAVKTWGAYAAKMALNLAQAASNPILLAATVAVAGLTAVYVAYSSEQQKAARETENFALAMKKQSNAFNEAGGAARYYADAFNKIVNKDDINKTIREISIEIGTLTQTINKKQNELEQLQITSNNDDVRRASRNNLLAFQRQQEELKAEISRMTTRLEFEKAKLRAALEGMQIYSQGMNEIMEEPISAPVIDDSFTQAAERWLKQWQDEYARFRAKISDDPFAEINLDLKLKLDEAAFYNANAGVIDQINEYYKAERSKIMQELKDESDKIQRELTKTKIDDLQYEYDEEIKKINKLEMQRVIAAGNSEEEIAAIRERFENMRRDTTLKFDLEINQTKLDEARESIKNWQEELSDNLLTGLMNLQIFSDKAAVILTNLTVQLAELSAGAALSGFEEFGRALAQGASVAESFEKALAAMAQQILKQLPMLFLQAGLNLISAGQWPLGLGLIAAAGTSAIISGFVDGASKHAQGGVFDEYGQAARAYAAGGTFTNQIVASPTYFAHGGGFGLMGEAGPEAIMPLTRMPNGDLGVLTAGTGSNVTVNIINNGGEEVRKEESESADGGKQIDVIIGDAINKHIASGKADRVMAGRYGTRPLGV